MKHYLDEFFVVVTVPLLRNACLANLSISPSVRIFLIVEAILSIRVEIIYFYALK
jgi:hypothetical protein